MSEDQKTLEDGIRLALQATEAAHDVSEEFAAIKAENQTSADKIEQGFKAIRVAVFGALAGAVAATVAGSLIYYRTLSDLKTMTETQTNSLVIFAERVQELNTVFAQVEALTEIQNQSIETQQDQTASILGGLDSLGTRVADQVTMIVTENDMLPGTISAALETQINEGFSGVSERMSDLASEITRANTQSIETALQSTDFVGLAAEVKAMRAVTVANRTAAPASRAAPKPKAPKPRAPAENPIKYP